MYVFESHALSSNGNGFQMVHFHLFVANRINGVCCLRFIWCLSFLWQIWWRQVRHIIIANAPIVTQIPKTMGNSTYQLSASLIGWLVDVFALSLAFIFESESVLGSEFHVCVVVIKAFVLFITSSVNENSIEIHCFFLVWLSFVW